MRVESVEVPIQNSQEGSQQNNLNAQQWIQRQVTAMRHSGRMPPRRVYRSSHLTNLQPRHCIGLRTRRGCHSLSTISRRAEVTLTTYPLGYLACSKLQQCARLDHFPSLGHVGSAAPLPLSIWLSGVDLPGERSRRSSDASLL